MAITVCLAIAFSYLLTDYVNLHRLQKRLDTQINQTRRSLSEMPLPDSGLTDLFEKSDKANQALKKTLGPGAASLTDIMDKILSDAENSHVQAVLITSAACEEKTIGKTIYRFQPLELTLSGSLPDIISLLEQLENPAIYPSFIVERLSISNSTDSDADGSDQVISSLTLAVVSERSSANQGE
jgi:hypothetical protein